MKVEGLCRRLKAMAKTICRALIGGFWLKRSTQSITFSVPIQKKLN